MKPYAASVVMKIMYGARMARFDLLRAIQGLAKSITTWSTVNDAELHRLVCYIHTTKSRRLCGWIGDSAENIYPVQFSDSDYAGCTETKRSTTGGFAALLGANSCFPL